MKFLFLDECVSGPLDSEKTKMVSLTGLVVPADAYQSTHDRFYKSLDWAIRPEPQVVGRPPELHGSDFLPEEADERKVEMFGKVVEMVLDSGLRIYRVGHYETPMLRQRGPSFVLGACWFGMLWVTQPEYADDPIIPVMDWLDPKTVPIFSGPVKGTDVMRAAGLGSSVSLRNSENILGEVFFADSGFSIMVQMVDVVSYLLHKREMLARGWAPASPFPRAVAEIAERLNPALAWAKTRPIVFDGVPQAPIGHDPDSEDPP